MAYFLEYICFLCSFYPALSVPVSSFWPKAVCNSHTLNAGALSGMKGTAQQINVYIFISCSFFLYIHHPKRESSTTENTCNPDVGLFHHSIPNSEYGIDVTWYFTISSNSFPKLNRLFSYMELTIVYTKHFRPCFPLKKMYAFGSYLPFILQSH